MALRRDTLLIFGASARAAAWSAVRAGFDVIAADLFADSDLQQVAQCIRVASYPDSFRDVRRQFPDVPVVYTGALENHPRLLEDFESGAGLLGTNADAVLCLRDPFALQASLQRAGLPFPKSRSALPTGDQHQWLRKRFRSAGGQHVQRCRPVQHNDNASTNGIVDRDGARCYFQRFLPGPVVSGSFLAATGRAVFLGATDMLVGSEWAGSQGFCYCGSIQRSCTVNEREQWMSIGNLLADEFRLAGLFGVDAILHEGQVTALEVNPRYTASMEVVEGVRPLVGMHVAACRDGHLPTAAWNESDESMCVGKAIVFATDRSRWPERMPTPPGARLADIPHAGTDFDIGDPIVTILIQSPTRDGVEASLRDATERVRQEVRCARTA